MVASRLLFPVLPARNDHTLLRLFRPDRPMASTGFPITSNA